MVERWVEWLFGESFGVEVVANYTQGEDSDGEEVAASVWRAEDLGEEVGFVFWWWLVVVALGG